ncbi:MAG: hypothetical protein EPO24_07690 [Bacteroidetes bacterium]|nr:MAG: hypothetical protein EPO24_07690 [Bacteroidota bacterium]
MRDGDAVSKTMHGVSGLQTRYNAVEIGGNFLNQDWNALLENCLKRFKNKGLSLKEGAKAIGIDLKSLYELEKAASGHEFSLGRKTVFKIEKYALNTKRGQRKPKPIKSICAVCGVSHINGEW